MQVLAVVSQKGGSGKTTLAGHIAVQAERSGAGPVALIDTDPQGSLAEWWNAREAPTPAFAATTIVDLAADLRRLRALGMRLVVIDTPPAIAGTIAGVVRVADLVIVPARPSPHDLRAAGATVDMIEALGRPLVFVVNGAAPRARITREAAAALEAHGTLAPTIVYNRTGFAASMIDGRTVMEIPGEAQAAQQIAALWDWLAGRLDVEAKDRSAAPVLRPTPVELAGPVA